MNTKRGKGYFYSMGQSDRANGRVSIINYKSLWPSWAITAYDNGWWGHWPT